VIERASALAARVPAESRSDLIRAASRGDGDAFQQVVATQLDRSYRTAKAILGNEEDARDATQDAFVSAWRDLAALRDPAQFDAWLQRIVVNACRTILRRRARVREIRLEPSFDRGDAAPALQDQVGDTDVLSRAFDRLDADKRSILVLHHLEHQPLASIAATLGIPVGTLKWRLADARGALARALVAEGGARR
jgi:RNA polymerase sigma-70 factor (ECF subfamily)